MRVTKYTWKYTWHIVFLVLLVIALLWNTDVRAASNVQVVWSGRYTHVLSWEYEIEGSQAYIYRRNPVFQGVDFMGNTTGNSFTFQIGHGDYSENDEYRIDEYVQDSQGFWYPQIIGNWTKLQTQRPNSRISVLPIIAR